jgi:hypothetical protein
VCADWWDTKGFHAWDDYGDKPAKDLTAAMKSREQVADELESEDSDNGDSGDGTVRNCDQIESLDEDSE